jgi:hypothetical protein
MLLLVEILTTALRANNPPLELPAFNKMFLDLTELVEGKLINDVRMSLTAVTVLASNLMMVFKMVNMLTSISRVKSSPWEAKTLGLFL